mgnify:CR=1 FL=1|jgi:hypothetical protein
MNNHLAVNTIIAGCFLNETIINLEGKVSLSKPGGEILYSAAGFNLWQKGIGLVTKLSKDQPLEWIKEISKLRINLSGIIKTTKIFDQQRFFAIKGLNKIDTTNPQKHFFEIGASIPKFLLDYKAHKPGIDNRNSQSSFSLTPDDIPENYLKAHNLVLCPLDYYSHSLLPAFFRSRTNGNVVLCASNGYMYPSFWYEIPALIRGSAVFLMTEKQVRNLFLGKTGDIWEMAEYLANCGVELIGIFGKERSLYLFEKPVNKKLFIPFFPSKAVDMVGTYAAFCGGFGAGFTTSFDPLKAGLMGIVTASINIEGSTPFHIFNALPELAQARLEALKSKVSII